MSMKIPCPKKPGWYMELVSAEEACRQPEYLKYIDMSVAQRIVHAEEIRRTLYGSAYLSGRFQGRLEELERA